MNRSFDPEFYSLQCNDALEESLRNAEELAGQTGLSPYDPQFMPMLTECYMELLTDNEIELEKFVAMGVTAFTRLLQIKMEGRLHAGNP